MSDGPFCACMSVEYRRIDHPGGTCSDSWVCKDCGSEFGKRRGFEYTAKQQIEENKNLRLYGRRLEEVRDRLWLEKAELMRENGKLKRVYEAAMACVADHDAAMKSWMEGLGLLAKQASSASELMTVARAEEWKNPRIEALRAALSAVEATQSNEPLPPPSAGKGGVTKTSEGPAKRDPGTAAGVNPQSDGAPSPSDSPTPASAVCECGHERSVHQATEGACEGWGDSARRMTLRPCGCPGFRPAAKATETPEQCPYEHSGEICNKCGWVNPTPWYRRAPSPPETPGPIKGGWCDLCSKLNWAQCSTDNVRCPNCGEFWCREHLKSHPEPAAPPVEKGPSEYGPRFNGFECLRHGERSCHSCLAYTVRDLLAASIPIADLEALAERWRKEGLRKVRLSDNVERSAGFARLNCEHDVRSLLEKAKP